MDSTQEQSGNDSELASEVMGSLGEGSDAGEEINQSHESVGHENAGDPLYVQKRLKQQKRAHDREIRDMQARMAQLQSQVGSRDNPQSFDANPNVNPGDVQASGGNIEELLRKAASFALQQREMEERKAKEAESAAHISRQYQDLQKHLDRTADKYDDFEDVVRGDSSPFTAHMRDASLMLPKEGPGSAGEVLYKLGKNPEELKRIAKLHPVDQAAEMVKLSHALISGGESKSSANTRPLGQVKANPVSNSAGVTEKTSPAAIRALMKAGKFK